MANHPLFFGVIEKEGSLRPKKVVIYFNIVYDTNRNANENVCDSC